MKESLTIFDILSVFTGFSGILLINFNPWEKPDLSENKHKENQKKEYLIGTMFALIGALGAGFAAIVMRYMKEGIHYSISPFWFASGCCFFSSIVFTITELQSNDDGHSTTVYDWTSMGVIAVESVLTFFG